jgi:hypothetical protein
VPAIEPDIRGAKSIRDMLAKHRSQASCASCHTKFDPAGFALENFDPAGQWRDSYAAFDRGRRTRGIKIDASYELADGRRFESLDEFQKLIQADAEQPVARGAHGTAVEVHDLCGGMNTGVGAPSAKNVDRFVGDAGQRFLERGLDADAVPLALPAVVGRTIVFDAECDAHLGST